MVDRGHPKLSVVKQLVNDTYSGRSGSGVIVVLALHWSGSSAGRTPG